MKQFAKIVVLVILGATVGGSCPVLAQAPDDESQPPAKKNPPASRDRRPARPPGTPLLDQRPDVDPVRGARGLPPGPPIRGDRFPSRAGPQRPQLPLRGGAAGDFRRGPFGDLEYLKQIDPEMYELERSDQEFELQSLELAQKFNRAAVNEREALRKELREHVNEHFEVRQKRRELQLKRLEEELKQLRSALDRRVKARDQIVEKRISELTGEHDPLDF